MPDRLTRHEDEGLYSHDEELIRKRAKIIIWDKLWRGFLAVAIVLLMTIMVYDVILGSVTRERIVSCTTRSGECYKENQDRSGQLVEQLQRSLVLAIICASREGVDTPRQVETCMVQLMEAENTE